MKFYFFIFTLLIFLPFSTASLSGSPSSLNFNMNVGEEQCLIFVVSSSDYSGDLTSIMKWAEKDAEVSSLNDFIFNNSETELNIEYSSETISDFDGEEQIEVCISGDEIGYWKGSLEYRTESSGNIGVGVGVWLRVNITEQIIEEEEQIPPATSESTNSETTSSSSGGGSSSSTTSTSNVQTPTENSTEVILEEEPLGELEEFTEEEQGIFRTTGSAISDFSKTKTGKGIFAILFALIIIFVVTKVYKRKFKK